MQSLQYTVRSVPELLDKRLRATARRSGKSLNTVIVEALARAEGLSEPTKQYHDLDWFIGSGIADSQAFDAAQRWQASLPNDFTTP